MAESAITTRTQTPLFPERKARGQFGSVLRRIRRSYHALAGGAIILLLALMAICAPLLAPDDPLEMNTQDRKLGPSREHWLGTDEFGRDVLSRIMYGARTSLRVGLLATALSISAGTLIGLTAGYFGRRVDVAISMVLDVMLAFPGLLLALAVIAILGTGLRNVLLALAVGGIPYYARLVRGQVLTIKPREYVEAARTIGVPSWRILVRHILPNLVSPLIVVGSIDLGYNILAAAGLSFIGLGAQPPSPEWGAMLSSGRDFMREQWWIAAFPGIAITITVLGFNLLGDGLRDVFDPRGID